MVRPIELPITAKYISKNEPAELNATVAEAMKQIKSDPNMKISKKLFKICIEQATNFSV